MSVCVCEQGVCRCVSECVRVCEVFSRPSDPALLISLASACVWLTPKKIAQRGTVEENKHCACTRTRPCGTRTRRTDENVEEDVEGKMNSAASLGWSRRAGGQTEAKDCGRTVRHQTNCSVNSVDVRQRPVLAGGCRMRGEG